MLRSGRDYMSNQGGADQNIQQEAHHSDRVRSIDLGSWRLAQVGDWPLEKTSKTFRSAYHEVYNGRQKVFGSCHGQVPLNRRCCIPIAMLNRPDEVKYIILKRLYVIWDVCWNLVDEARLHRCQRHLPLPAIGLDRCHRACQYLGTNPALPRTPPPPFLAGVLSFILRWMLRSP